MITPPIKKQQVAIKDGNCRFDNPEMECPLVQPPAYLEPKPIIKPPTTITKNPLSVNRLSHEKSWSGKTPLMFVIPYVANSELRFTLIAIGLGLGKKSIVTSPPSKIPITKKKFQISFFHSYEKNGMFAGMQAAHACRKLALMPKFLFPKINSAGTVNPTSGPATNQGQGWLKNFIISIM